MTYILSDYCQLFRNKNRLFIQSSEWLLYSVRKNKKIQLKFSIYQLRNISNLIT